MGAPTIAVDETLSQAEADCLLFIVKYKIANDGLSPRLRDIAKGFNTSTSVVHYRLAALEAKGRIRRNRNAKRDIEVMGGHWFYGGPAIIAGESPVEGGK